MAQTISTDLIKVVRFLGEIGIECMMEPDASGFLDLVRVDRGTLRFDPRASVSDILHEAGHIAILPPQFRALAQGDLTTALCVMVELAHHLDPDHPFSVATMQCGDVEATAWAWAAGVHLGLQPGVIIQDDDYEGEGAMHRVMLSTSAYLGINGLQRAGLCSVRASALAAAKGLPVYPQLRVWLQDVVVDDDVIKTHLDNSLLDELIAADRQADSGHRTHRPTST